MANAGTATITEKDVASMLLSHAKAFAQKCCTAAVEATSPELNRLFIGEVEKCLTFQRDVWEFMRQKGWYDPYTLPRQMADQDLKEAESVLP
jgi:spore coat protein CotF